MPITALDVSLFVVMLISGLIGAGRGILRSFFALSCCWIAGYASGFVFIGPNIGTSALNQTDTSAIMKNAVLADGLFVVILIPTLFFAARFIHNTLDPMVGPVDRTVGFLCGLLRGLFIATLLFILYAWLVPTRSHPEWFRDAQAVTLLKSTSVWLLSMLPNNGEGGGLIFVSLGNALLLGLVVDLVAIVARWMGRVPAANRGASGTAI